MIAIPEQKSYTGRLAFDPDSGLHVDEKGKYVATDDEGKSWHYVSGDDAVSHFSRYHKRIAVIDTTVNADEPEPHHYEVHPDDPHFDGVLVDPDHEAAKVTGHTEAYKS